MAEKRSLSELLAHPSAIAGMRQAYPETMGPHQLVISREKSYHIDIDGLVSVVGRTAEVLILETKEPNP